MSITEQQLREQLLKTLEQKAEADSAPIWELNMQLATQLEAVAEDSEEAQKIHLALDENKHKLDAIWAEYQKLQA